MTNGSLSHSASEHSDVTLDCVVEAESFSELSALIAPFPLIGGGGGNSPSSVDEPLVDNSVFPPGIGSGPLGP